MEIHLNMSLLRHFLRTGIVTDGHTIVRMACDDGEPAAVQLLVLCLKIRANPRTRRTFDSVTNALRSGQRPRWLTKLERHLFSLYRLLSAMSAPSSHRPTSGLHLSRRQQRILSATGVVRENRTTLKQQASTTAKALFGPRVCRHLF